MAELRITTALDTSQALSQAEAMRQRIARPLGVDLGPVVQQLQRMQEAAKPSVFGALVARVQELGRAKFEVADVERLAAAMRATGQAGVESVDAFASAARGRMAGTLDTMTAGVGAMVHSFLALPAPMKVAIGLAAGLAAAVGAVRLAASALRGVFALLAVPLRAALSLVQSVFGAIGSLAGKVWSGIKGAVSGLLSAVGGVLEKITSVLSPGVAFAGGGLVGFILARVLGHLQADTGPLAGVRAQAGAGKESGLLQSVLDQVAPQLLALVKTWQGLFAGTEGLAAMIAGYLGPALDWVRTHLVVAADTVLATIQQALLVIDGVIGAVLGIIAGDWKGAVGALSLGASELVRGMAAIVQVVAPMMDNVVDWLARTAGDLVSVMGEGMARLETPMREMAAAVTGSMARVVGWIGEKAGVAAGTAHEAGATWEKIANVGWGTGRFETDAGDEGELARGVAAAAAPQWAVDAEAALRATQLKMQTAQGTPIADWITDQGLGLRKAGENGVGASSKLLAWLDAAQQQLATWGSNLGGAGHMGTVNPVVDAIQAVRDALGAGVAPDAAAAAAAADPGAGAARQAEAQGNVSTAIGPMVVSMDRGLLLQQQAVTTAKQQLDEMRLLRQQSAGGALA